MQHQPIMDMPSRTANQIGNVLRIAYKVLTNMLETGDVFDQSNLYDDPNVMTPQPVRVMRPKLSAEQLRKINNDAHLNEKLKEEIANQHATLMEQKRTVSD